MKMVDENLEKWGDVYRLVSWMIWMRLIIVMLVVIASIVTCLVLIIMLLLSRREETQL